MTEATPDPDHDDIDELVSAYLDGQATDAERARVQRDPQLLARLEELRAVSEMIAETVPLPDATQRDGHIAAALAASATSPVVSSLPTRRKPSGPLRFASIAAAVLVILVAVPLLLAEPGDDEDTASEAIGTADDDADDDAVATNESAPESDRAGTAMADAGEAAPASPEPTGDEAVASQEMAAGDEAEMETSEEAEEAEEAEAFTIEQPADGAASAPDAVRIDIGRVASPQALRREVDDRLKAGVETADDDGAGDDGAGDDGAGNDATSPGLICGPAIAELIADQGPATAFGSVILFNTISEYVVLFDGSAPVILFDTATCTVRAGG